MPAGTVLPLGPHAGATRYGRRGCMGHHGGGRDGDDADADRCVGDAVAAASPMGGRATDGGFSITCRADASSPASVSVTMAGGSSAPSATRPTLSDEGRCSTSSLELFQQLLRGDAVHFKGRHYRVETSAFGPKPHQDPLPIWGAVRWPNRKPLRRIATLQGASPSSRRAGRQLRRIPRRSSRSGRHSSSLEAAHPSILRFAARSRSRTRPAFRRPSPPLRVRA